MKYESDDFENMEVGGLPQIEDALSQIDEDEDSEKFSALATADSIEDGAISFYKEFMHQFPGWGTIIQEMLDSAAMNKGRIAALRDAIGDGTGELIEQGKSEAARQLSTVDMGDFSEFDDVEDTGDALVINLLNK